MEIIPSGQGCAGARLFLFFFYSYVKGLGDHILTLMLIVAVAACVRFEPQPLPPEQIAFNFGSRTLDNAKLKEFLETNMNRNFFNWPTSSWGFSMLILAALYYHPELNVAGAKHISTNTK